MTKTDVIKAAFRAWGRELYQKTSLSQIARELGVTKPALYRHFKNKQELLNEMYVYFFDEYAAAVKADYERALETEDRDECFLIMARSLVRFYGLNRDIFIFSLVRVYGNRQTKDTGEQLARRGVDMRRLLKFGESAWGYPSLVQFVLATVIFWVGYFHKTHERIPEAVSADEAGALVERELVFLEQKLGAGLGLDRGTVAAMDFRGLEGRLDGGLPEYSEDDRLLRAVAAAVAEAGPWNASMGMVARRSGLSKSGLYSHFESKREMLIQLFFTEMERLIAYTGASRKKSSRPEEQLYLGMIAAAYYLRSRPEFLVAIDWLRLRNPNLWDCTPPRLGRAFQGIDLEGLREDSRDSPDSPDSPDLPDLPDLPDSESRTERLAWWIFFLIINVLMRWKAGEWAASPSVENIAGVPNECFRLLYKFIALGMKGFDV